MTDPYDPMSIAGQQFRLIRSAIVEAAGAVRGEGGEVVAFRPYKYMSVWVEDANPRLLAGARRIRKARS